MGYGPTRKGNMGSLFEINVVKLNAPASPEAGGASHATGGNQAGISMMLVDDVQQARSGLPTAPVIHPGLDHHDRKSLACTFERKRQSYRSRPHDADISMCRKVSFVHYHGGDNPSGRWERVESNHRKNWNTTLGKTFILAKGKDRFTKCCEG